MARALDVTAPVPTVALSAGAANVVTATIQMRRAGTPVGGVFLLDVWISRDANGQGLTATAASGNLAATSGAILTALTAKKQVSAVTNANGALVLTLEDTAKTQGEYFCVSAPGGSRPIVVSAATVTASYG